MDPELQTIPPGLWADQLQSIIWSSAMILTAFVVFRASFVAFSTTPHWISRQKKLWAAVIRDFYRDGAAAGAIGAWIAYFGWRYCVMALQHREAQTVYGPLGIFLTTVGVYVAVSAFLDKEITTAKNKDRGKKEAIQPEHF